MSSQQCRQFEADLIDPDKIGVCTGTCNYNNAIDCQSSCECHSVDLDWQPNLQDYATYVICVGRQKH